MSESLYLPPMIPANTVIDSGPTAGETTNNRPMWFPVSANLRFQPGVVGGGTVPTALVNFNHTYPHGFNDWQIPSQSTVTGLLTGFTGNGNTPNRFLSALNASSTPGDKSTEIRGHSSGQTIS